MYVDAFFFPILGMLIQCAMLLLLLLLNDFRLWLALTIKSVSVFVIEIFHVTGFGCQVTAVKNNIYMYVYIYFVL